MLANIIGIAFFILSDSFHGYIVIVYHSDSKIENKN